MIEWKSELSLRSKTKVKTENGLDFRSWEIIASVLRPNDVEEAWSLKSATGVNCHDPLQLTFK